jgi:hypothetical protein
MDGCFTRVSLPIAVYAAHFSVASSVTLPEYLGSAVRGAFGHALKKTVCVTRQKQCETCMLYRTCPYSYIFETPPPVNTEKMRRYTSAPHPFVFDLPLSNNDELKHSTLVIGFSLFGRGNQFLPYVLHALEEAGKQGIKHINLQLIRLEQRTDLTGKWDTIFTPGGTLAPSPALSPSIPPCPAQVTLHFDTPLRLKREGRNVTPAQFEFADFFINLMRRISMLEYFHADNTQESDYAKLAETARAVAFTHKALHWHDWKRYSSRQQTTMSMGGLIGSVQLNMADMDAFWPWIWLGQWTHAGKASSMGLGKYRIETATSLPQQTNTAQ